MRVTRSIVRWFCGTRGARGTGAVSSFDRAVGMRSSFGKGAGALLLFDCADGARASFETAAGLRLTVVRAGVRCFVSAMDPILPIAPDCPLQQSSQRGHDVTEPVRPQQRKTAGTATKLVSATARLYSEWLGILVGNSARDVPARDSRFADPAWRDQPVYKRLAQGTSR